MSDFTITERTEPFTLDEVFNFIDDTNISKKDACELKSRIVDAVQEIRAKAIEEFAERLHELCGFEIDGIQYPYLLDESRIDEIAEQMKGGAT